MLPFSYSGTCDSGFGRAELPLSAVPITVSIIPDATSTPVWAFISNCQSLTFSDRCISGSRPPSLFLVDGVAAIKVACHKWRPLNPHRTGQNTAGTGKCSTCALVRLADDLGPPPSGREARSAHATFSTASRHQFQRGSGRAASNSSWLRI